MRRLPADHRADRTPRRGGTSVAGVAVSGSRSGFACPVPLGTAATSELDEHDV
jgi:hypothetical protein